jgi:deoxyribodipyrimidine photo-lyase
VAKRNDPNSNNLSNLSPYIHYGHISVQKLVIVLKQSKKFPSDADGFIEEVWTFIHITMCICVSGYIYIYIYVYIFIRFCILYSHP